MVLDARRIVNLTPPIRILLSTLLLAKRMSSLQGESEGKEVVKPIRAKLIGHTAPVLCLACKSNFVASGSEDGTVRLWDCSTRETCLVIQCEKEVQAIALCPFMAMRSSDTKKNHSDATKECRNKTKADDDHGNDDDGDAEKQDLNDSAIKPIALPDALLLFACDNTLYICDLTNISLSQKNDPIIISANTLSTLWQTTDEINQIAWTCAPAPITNTTKIASDTTTATMTKGSRKKKRKPPRNHLTISSSTCVWIATADDAGQIWVAPEPWNCDNTNDITVLTHSTEEALCLTVVLRTTCKGRLELLSGGSDCRLVRWQQQRQQSTHRWTQQSEIDMNQIEECDGGDGGGPLWNPPMVHQMDWGSGTYVATACGDGRIRMFQTNAGRFVLTAVVEHATVPACAIATMKDDESDYDSGTADADYDFDKSSSTTIPSHRLLWSAGNDGICKLWDVGSFVAGVDSAQNEDLEHGAPRLLQTLRHGAKPNALVVTNNGRLWVTDTTNNITDYDVSANRYRQ